MNLLRAGAKDALYLGCRALAVGRDPASVILMYHHVRAPLGPGSRFADQVSSLAERFRVVPLREFVDELDTAQAPLACITFDDGYANALEGALPVLADAGLSATFFLVPALIGGSLETSLGLTTLLSWSQAEELRESGHEIGAHTMTHPQLTQIHEDHASDEIVSSKEQLEDRLQVEVASFAYPKGRFDGAIRDIVATAGYSAAVTVREGTVAKGPSLDRFALPRVQIAASTSRAQFRGKTSAGVDVYERIVRSRA